MGGKLKLVFPKERKRLIFLSKENLKLRKISEFLRIVSDPYYPIRGYRGKILPFLSKLKEMKRENKLINELGIFPTRFFNDDVKEDNELSCLCGIINKIKEVSSLVRSTKIFLGREKIKMISKMSCEFSEDIIFLKMEGVKKSICLSISDVGL